MGNVLSQNAVAEYVDFWNDLEFTVCDMKKRIQMLPPIHREVLLCRSFLNPGKLYSREEIALKLRYEMDVNIQADHVKEIEEEGHSMLAHEETPIAVRYPHEDDYLSESHWIVLDRLMEKCNKTAGDMESLWKIIGPQHIGSDYVVLPRLSSLYNVLHYEASLFHDDTLYMSREWVQKLKEFACKYAQVLEAHGVELRGVVEGDFVRPSDIYEYEYLTPKFARQIFFGRCTL
ncbi:MAG: hypothetical protein K5678_05225 [Acetatifactor sp.]|nr:hypothetical protein [Acetatifactor sp.]